ncbi:MAG: Zn-dependent hydrolase [Chloroflexi bacterium]|nr:Zn-dependent hydrolase [Chloroflexota bacterium]
MPIQKDRLVERLNTLGQIGATAEGGVTRLAYTPEYRQAEEVVRGWLAEAGLTSRLDAVGNLIGRREGRQPRRPSVMLASHIDSVVNGGHFDGALGMLSAVEVAQALHEDGLVLAAPLEVVAFMDEEGPRWGGGLFGSRAMTGQITPQMLDRRDRQGVSVFEAMQQWGLDPTQLGKAVRNPAEIGAYLELHIEQGAVLESLGLAVGVVTAIAGPLHLATRLRGRTDHAGATPMGELRRDALVGAAELILAAEATAKTTSPTCVATVGRLEVTPGVANIIPGEVFMTFDIRDIDETARDRAVGAIRREIERVCQARRLSGQVEEALQVKPVILSHEIVETVATACRKFDLPVYHLPSGAGHDAQIMAGVTKAGMIFVRCREGISHSPAEYVTPEDAFVGAQVLYEATVQLGRS